MKPFIIYNKLQAEEVIFLFSSLSGRQIKDLTMLNQYEKHQTSTDAKYRTYPVLVWFTKYENSWILDHQSDSRKNYNDLKEFIEHFSRDEVTLRYNEAINTKKSLRVMYPELFL